MENTENKSKIWNIPNILSLLRCAMVPLFVAAMWFLPADTVYGRLIPAALFGLTALTDMLDGKIARKYNMVTTFGKFIDPLADKFMIFAALLMVTVVYSYLSPVYIWVAVIIFFRELGVTSLRLVVSGQSGIVVAASILGKAKTVSQIFGILLVMLEPYILPGLYANGIYLISWIIGGIMVLTTLISGYDYLRAYWPVIRDNA